MPLEAYARKRDFSRTAEPRPSRPRKKTNHHFVIQKHDARALHYDFRLEHDGVLLSWAVPKGPSLDPKVKRLAMQVEDHPVEYRHFEGVIPEGEYGAGPVIVWDQGEWLPDSDPDEMLKKGRLTFELRGEKLHGGFHLVRTGGRTPSPKRSQWLLIKRADTSARPGSGSTLVDDAPESVVSGRTLQDVAEGREHGRKAPRRKKAPKAATKVAEKAAAKAVEKATARLPDFVAPQLATLVDRPPAGDGWVHEMKLDGYRILARVADGAATLRSRNGKDWTARFPRIAKAAADAAPDGSILDGEVVVFREDGVSDFQRLQNSLDEGGDESCTYVVFDAPFLGGTDLRGEPLLDRKARLSKAFSRRRGSGRIRLGEHVTGTGAKVLGEACRLGLEGIVSKQAGAPYESKRTRSWLKVKCLSRQEFVIGGYTEPEGSRTKFGALLLGVREDGQLRYAGKVGTGFTTESLERIAQKLEKLERDEPPFVDPPRGSAARGVHWVAPQLVGEVEFTELTRDGKVRHSTFRGLREDKPARDVRPERAARTKEIAAPASAPPPSQVQGSSRLRLTHPDRVIYPRQGLTKGDLALYYARVAPFMVPLVAHRPLMIVRCPEGAGTTCFHQKHPSRGMSEAVHPVDVEQGKGARGKKPSPHLAIEDAEGLIGLVQMGAVEIHAWGSRSDRLEYPDQLVFDLDPDDGLPAARIIEAARTVRERLEALGLVTFLKTTGGKGLHVTVPVVPDTPWEAAKAFCRVLVDGIARSAPKKYVTTMGKEHRAGRVFLDYLRNARGATSVCPYSARAREGARVSAPVAWDELDASLLRRGFDVRSMPARLDSSKGDPWAGFDAARVRIPQV